MIKHPEGTYLVRVTGDSMKDARIEERDFLIVDRAQKPDNGDIILAMVDGEFTVKRLIKKPDGIWRLQISSIPVAK